MIVDVASLNQVTGSAMRAVKLCYEYAYLRGRIGAGLRLDRTDEARLASLKLLLENGSRGERRRHRRIPLALPVVLKTPAGLCRGTLLNIGGGGMFVMTAAAIAPGTTLQVKRGQPGQGEYSYPCTVQWVAPPSSAACGLGLRCVGVPVEVRHAGISQAAA